MELETCRRNRRVKVVKGHEQVVILIFLNFLLSQAAKTTASNKIGIKDEMN